jgi:hypothetical protein
MAINIFFALMGSFSFLFAHDTYEKLSSTCVNYQVDRHAPNLLKNLPKRTMQFGRCSPNELRIDAAGRMKVKGKGCARRRICPS